MLSGTFSYSCAPAVSTLTSDVFWSHPSPGTFECYYIAYWVLKEQLDDSPSIVLNRLGLVIVLVRNLPIAESLVCLRSLEHAKILILLWTWRDSNNFIDFDGIEDEVNTFAVCLEAALFLWDSRYIIMRVESVLWEGEHSEGVKGKEGHMKSQGVRLIL